MRWFMIGDAPARDLTEKSAPPGALVFALAFFGIGLLLLLMLGDQTTWANGKPLTSQPRFWPSVSIALMIGFGALHVIGLLRSGRRKGSVREFLLWLRSLEFAAWLIIYALAVPYLGYLPATVLIALVLGFRLGYRRSPAIMATLGSAILIVMIFRVLLQVKLPGGAIYHWLPEHLSNFMLTYF